MANFNFRHCTAGDKIFYIIIFFILTSFFLAVLYPVVFVVSASISSADAILSGRVVLFPVGFNVEGYKTVFNTPNVWIGFRNSVLYTAASIVLAVTLTMMAAYVLSRTDLPGGNFIMLLFTFTMFFSGGIIPSYMLIRALGFLNTPLAVIVPGSIGVFNMIIARTFIRHNIPGELLDSARIDGCSDIGYFVKIVIPLSQAIIAVLVLFYGVSNWNAFFGPMIYLSNRNLFPLTLFLREILMLGQIDPSTVTDPEMQMRLAEAAAVIRYALIIVTIIPVIMIYPFVQKYFIQGIMIGSIKG